MPDVILDRTGKVAANLHHLVFEQTSNAYLGDIEFISAPTNLLQQLTRLEDVVENQTFALVDELQAAVDAFGLTVQFGDGNQYLIHDLYVNRNGGVSFRVEMRQP